MKSFMHDFEVDYVMADGRIVDNPNNLLLINYENAKEVITKIESMNSLLVIDSVNKSKGKWKFERSSGYAGYRCQVCYVWIYNNQEKICNCDK
jgi:hypothetical protein